MSSQSMRPTHSDRNTGRCVSCTIRQMTVTQLFLAELERETLRSRHALEQVPEGRRDWKPHEKSMAFGYLCDLVAVIPTWITKMVEEDQLDIAPKDGPSFTPPPSRTSADYVRALDDATDQAHKALRGTSDELLDAPWKLLAAGNVVAQQPRHVMIQDTFGHWAHHRGQLTVYLRLLNAKVPALYGPSADDRSFA